MNRYWIKLYHEILYDHKVAVLPDHLWRRMIELFLIAGEYGGRELGGILPPVAQIAWIVHSTPEEVERELNTLSTIGIVERDNDGVWRVVNFVKRQAAATDAERQAARRTKTCKNIASRNVTKNVTKRDEKCHENVTKNVRDKQITDINNVVVVVKGEGEAENQPENGDADAVKQVYRAYEREIGPLTPQIVMAMDVAIEKYPLEWILRAISEAAISNARSWRYVEGVLRNWQTHGFKSPKPTRNRSTTSKHDNNAEVIRSILEEYEHRKEDGDNGLA